MLLLAQDASLPCTSVGIFYIFLTNRQGQSHRILILMNFFIWHTSCYNESHTEQIHFAKEQGEGKREIR